MTDPELVTKVLEACGWTQETIDQRNRIDKD